MADQTPGMFTKRDAQRIANCVASYEKGSRNQRPIKYPRNYIGGSPVRLGKTTAAWNKGTLATITLYEDGTPPGETTASPAETLEKCVNKFANVASGKWVIVAKGANGSWYLIAAECEEQKP
jgi:hypothetical protein